RHGLVPLTPLKIRNLLRPLFQKLTGQSSRGGYWLSPRLQAILEARRGKFRSQPLPALPRRGEFSLLLALDYAFDAFGRETGESLGARHALEFRQPFFAR